MRELEAQLSAEEFVFVGLSVENHLRPSQLAQYADQHDFGWRFAVMTQEFLAAIVTQYDSRAIVPPSTPHFVISPTGELSALALGHHDVASLRAKLEASAGAE